MELITSKYSSKIRGILSCYDRIVITGTLPVLSNYRDLTHYFYTNNIRVFDYARFADPYRHKLRENAEKLAAEAGTTIQFVNSSVRKEAVIEAQLKKRGSHPGLIQVLSAMERCKSYKPWHDKSTGKSFLKHSEGKCLTYYFYFIDDLLGLCYVRVPTWLPFQLQIYLNGHNWLASELKGKKIGYEILDNAFLQISDWEKAQKISDSLKVEKLHKKLDEFASIFCPVHKDFKQQYHWSILQCEYATDIVFKKQKDLKPVYEHLIATAMHTIKPENIVTFLGKKLDHKYKGEIGNQYNVRLQGSRIKHHMGSVSIKMYDKFGQILRIETTTNYVSFFKHYREVRHLNGTASQKLAYMKKNIYSFKPLKEILGASNHRYIEFISSINDYSMGRKKLEKVTDVKTVENRKYTGVNFFSKKDQLLLLILSRGEFNIYGFRSKNLAKFLDYSASQLSRLLKRLRVHGLIKRIGKSYKYYLTKLGKEVINCGQKVISLVIIPQLSVAAYFLP